jgi:hypothetical protein
MMSCTPHIFRKNQSRITNFHNQSYFALVLGYFFAKAIAFENSKLVFRESMWQTVFDLRQY